MYGTSSIDGQQVLCCWKTPMVRSTKYISTYYQSGINFMLEKSYTIISKQSLLDELIYSFNDNTILSISKKILMKAIFSKF